MKIISGDLHDNQGNKIGTAIPDSVVGYFNGERDGGIIAGAITKIKIDGRSQQVVYAWSVKIEEGGRKSGWMLMDNFDPKTDIRNILQQNKDDRLALIEDRLKDSQFVKKTVGEVYLPDEAAEWYLMPGRDSSYTAGKAKYYFTRDGLISGIKNIPETGSQRYGVAHDVAPIGTPFYVDLSTDEVEVEIYEPSAETPSDYSLKLVFGYFVNSSGRKWYSWINSEVLD